MGNYPLSRNVSRGFRPPSAQNTPPPAARKTPPLAIWAAPRDGSGAPGTEQQKQARRQGLMDIFHTSDSGFRPPLEGDLGLPLDIETDLRILQSLGEKGSLRGHEREGLEGSQPNEKATQGGSGDSGTDRRQSVGHRTRPGVEPAAAVTGHVRLLQGGRQNDALLLNRRLRTHRVLRRYLRLHRRRNHLTVQPRR